MKVSRVLRKIGIVLLCIIGFQAVVIVGLQIYVNSKSASRFVGKLAAEYVDADLKWSDLKISFLSDFPKVSVGIDSLSVTYPHGRYSDYDSVAVYSRLLKSGRGESVDTLAFVSSFAASVNLFELIAGRINLGKTQLDGLRLFAHQYDSTASNWNIFKTASEPEPEEVKDSSKLSLPWISVEGIEIGGHPRIIYTAQCDTVFLALRFSRVALSGSLKLDFEDMDINLRKLSADIDSLAVFGRLPADTLGFRLDRLDLRTPSRNTIDLGFDSSIMAMTYAFGRLRIPVNLDSRFYFNTTRNAAILRLDRFRLDLAHFPFYARGSMQYRDSLYVDVSAGLDRCKIDEVLSSYGKLMGNLSEQINTDGVISINAESKGWLSSRQLPATRLGISLPDCHFSYLPLDLPLTLGIEADGQMASDGRVDAVLQRLLARGKGVDLSVSGSAADLTGRDPSFKCKASGYAESAEALKFLPDSIGILSEGRVDIGLDVRTRMSELKRLRFDHSVIKGSVRTPGLDVEIKADSLVSKLHRTAISFNSSPKGIDIDVEIDSLSSTAGASTRLKSRRIGADAHLCMVEHRGKMVPKMSVHTSLASVFMKSGRDMLGLRQFELGASLRKVVAPTGKRQWRRMPPKDGALPDYLSEKDFRKSDVAFSLDSSMIKLFNAWSPSFDIRLGRAFVASPSLPLRTRVRGLYGKFDGRTLSLDSLNVKCGTSDIIAKGTVSGLRPILSGRRSVIGIDADIHSHRLNLNELAAASKIADETDSKSPAIAKETSEYDESFVVDSLSGAGVTASDFKLFVLPANLIARIGVKVDTADFLQLKINPLSMDASLKERTLKISDVSLKSNCGDIGLNAFYSTKTKKDITAGVDLALQDISVGGFLNLLPSMDNMLPALKSFDGNINCNIAGTAQLDTNMNVIMPSLDGVVGIDGKDLVISDMSSLRKITRLLLFKDLKKSRIASLSVDAIVNQSKLQIFPFELAVDRYDLALQGVQNFDKTMSYHVSVMKSPLLIPFGVNIWGSLDKVKFSLGAAKYKSGRIPVYTEQIDTMHINIAKSIGNIFTRGAEEVRRYNGNAARKLSKSLSSDTKPDMSAVSPELDSLMFSRVVDEMDASAAAEVNEAVKKSDAEIEKIVNNMDLPETRKKRSGRRNGK